MAGLSGERVLKSKTLRTLYAFFCNPTLGFTSWGRTARYSSSNCD